MCTVSLILKSSASFVLLYFNLSFSIADRINIALFFELRNYNINPNVKKNIAMFFGIFKQLQVQGKERSVQHPDL